METLEGADRARGVIASYRLNRSTHEADDELKAKCARYVHGIHFTPEEVRKREADGLASVVADETHGVWTTLDGWARNNRSTVQFMGLGEDDPKAAELYNKLYSAIRSQSGLQSLESEAYGLAVIEDEAFLHVYPQKNGLGQLEPCSEILGLNQCYPEPNALDAIDLNDAAFIDLPRYMSAATVLRTYKAYLTDTLKARIESRMRADGATSTAANLGLSADNSKSRNGQYEVVTRYYRKAKVSRSLLDLESGERRDVMDDEVELLTPEVAEEMGFHLEEEEDLINYRCVFIPEISETELIMDEPCDFQPWDPVKGRMWWPVKRLPHKMVAGKAMGAIRAILSLQDARNIILSSLQLHLQTAANGGMMYEDGTFVDEEEERKFKEDRNHAAASIKTKKGALKDKRIAPIERGNVAFNDFGELFNSVLLDAIRKITGAEPVMRGQAQGGAPSSLYKQQVEQAQNQMMGSADLYRDFQFAVADIIMAFVRQFYNERRVLMIEGSQGDEQLVINHPTYAGVLNDVSQGLFTVRKTSAPTTASARRQRLADDLELAQTLLNLSAPAFLVDWEGIIDDLDKPQESRDRLKNEFRMWKASQGIGALPAGPMAPGAPAGMQAPMPQPKGQPAFAPA